MKILSLVFCFSAVSAFGFMPNVNTNVNKAALGVGRFSGNKGPMVQHLKVGEPSSVVSIFSYFWLSPVIVCLFCIDSMLSDWKHLY